LQAAMGLAVLPYMPSILEERKRVVNFYNQNIDITRVQLLKIRENTHWNYSYYPIIFKDETSLLKVQKALNDNQIFPRRYFYPSLNTLNYIEKQKMPISEIISSTVLCLPLFVGLNDYDLKLIVSSINNTLK
jgi:dTDP-4-amino-4,6-dideoxygalactose transaminase